MANLITVKAFQTPFGNESPSKTHAISVSSIQDVVSFTTSGISGVNTAISVAFKNANATQTSAYLVNESLTDVVTAANA